MVNSRDRRRRRWTAWVAWLVTLAAAMSASGNALAADDVRTIDGVSARGQTGVEHPSADAPRLGPIRPAPGAVADALAHGLRCSPTLRELADDLSRYDAIVLVHEGNAAVFGSARINGATFNRVTVVGTHRYVHVAVMADRGRATIGTIARELQQVRELLASGATDEAEIRALYLRIGSATGNVLETLMAQEIGLRVRSEVSRCGR